MKLYSIPEQREVEGTILSPEEIHPAYPFIYTSKPRLFIDRLIVMPEYSSQYVLKEATPYERDKLQASGYRMINL